MVSCFMCQFVNAVGYSWLINRNCVLTFDVLFYLSFWCDHINQFGYLLIFAVGKRFIVLQKIFAAFPYSSLLYSMFSSFTCSECEKKV